MKLAKIIKSPAYMAEKPWKTIPFTTAIVVLCLFLSHPWGKFDWATNLRIAFLSGLVSAMGETAHYYLLPRLFPRWHDTQYWTVGKQVLSTMTMLLTIATSIYAFYVVVFRMPVSLPVLFYFVFIFLLITPLPLTFGLMWSRNLELQRNLRLANELNERIMEKLSEEKRPKESDSSKKAITFPDGRNSDFTVSPENILFICSEGNYVNVVFFQEGQCKEKMLRCTMKTIEQKMESCAEIVRCHRSFFVNLSKVKMVTGNVQECLLHFDELRQTVPVSRSYRKDIVGRIRNSR